MKKMVPESYNEFKRGDEPHKALGVGHKSLLDEVSPMDSELTYGQYLNEKMSELDNFHYCIYHDLFYTERPQNHEQKHLYTHIDAQIQALYLAYEKITKLLKNASKQDFED